MAELTLVILAVQSLPMFPGFIERHRKTPRGDQP